MTRFAQVDMNAVAPLLPGDKVAGRVAARGEHFDFKPSANGKVHPIFLFALGRRQTLKSCYRPLLIFAVPQ